MRAYRARGKKKLAVFLSAINMCPSPLLRRLQVDVMVEIQSACGECYYVAPKLKVRVKSILHYIIAARYCIFISSSFLRRRQSAKAASASLHHPNATWVLVRVVYP